jgi:hypothetical protein
MSIAKTFLMPPEYLQIKTQPTEYCHEKCPESGRCGCGKFVLSSFPRADNKA